MENLNLWAVLVAAGTSFLLGGLWYSKALLGAVWCREAGQTQQGAHPGRVFAVSFLFCLVSAAAFAWWLGPAPPLATAVSRGILVGAGMVAASFGVNYQFAERSTLLWLIDGGYHTAQFVLYGLVLGLWH